jgi:rhodanese-related sulfurtransferase
MMRHRGFKRSKAIIFWACLIAAGIGFVAGPAAWPAAEGGPFPEEISVAEARAKLHAGALILDVRQPEEYASGHIPGATLIPIGQLERRANELPRDREIVVVCRSGGRSAMGRDILKKAGFTNVTSMAQGMNAWKAAGYPIVQIP